MPFMPLSDSPQHFYNYKLSCSQTNPSNHKRKLSEVNEFLRHFIIVGGIQQGSLERVGSGRTHVIHQVLYPP
jgi:hypothetical protein